MRDGPKQAPTGRIAATSMGFKPDGDHSVSVARQLLAIPRDHEPFATGGLVKRAGQPFGAAVRTEPLPDTGRAPADQAYTVVKLDVGDRFPDLADLMRSRRPPGHPVRIEADE